MKKMITYKEWKGNRKNVKSKFRKVVLKYDWIADKEIVKINSMFPDDKRKTLTIYYKEL